VRFTGRTVAQDGIERYLRCEHCGHNQTDLTQRPVPDIRCNKCGKKQEA